MPPVEDLPVLLSTKPIPVAERLIFALDVGTQEEAIRLVDHLDDSVQFYKLGLELFMAEGYFELIRELDRRGKKVFADLKFFDVPRTVESAVRQLDGRGVTFASVHGNDDILAAACKARGQLQILAVTVLTSLDRHDMEDLGFSCEPEALVLSRAKRALRIGCDGIISSGREVATLRKELGSGFVVVAPGIRSFTDKPDDQKRTATPEEAFLAGADYIVVGRPIRDAADPRTAAEAIQETIARLFPQ
jgi:orotidine-5'-phosphate decarboxylase